MQVEDVINVLIVGIVNVIKGGETMYEILKTLSKPLMSQLMLIKLFK